MYADADVKRAYAKSKADLYHEIGIIYPGVNAYTKDELVALWLEGYGQQREEHYDCGPLCDLHGDPRDTSLVMEARR